MNLGSLALRHVMRSARSYRLWFVSVAASACAFYLFQAASFDPTIARLVASKMSLTIGMTVAAVILAIFTGVFMGYSASFFVRGRAREIGLYRLFGIGRVRIALMLLAENAIAGAAALLVGLVAGVLGSKLFLMALARTIDLEADLSLVLDARALGWTAAAFCLLILVASAIAAAAVFRTELALVFQKERSADRSSRWNSLIGALSLPLLAAAYILASLTTIQYLIVNFLIASALTIAGTWAFARGAGSLLVKLLRQNDRFFLKGSRMIALSNVAHRIASNSRVFFVIALVSAVSMIALGVGLNMKYYLETNLAIYLPHDVSLASANPAAIQKILADIEAEGVRATSVGSLPYIKAVWQDNVSPQGYAMPSRFRFFAASNYLALAEKLGRDPNAARLALGGLQPGQGAIIETIDDPQLALVGHEHRFNLDGEQAKPFTLLMKTRIALPAVDELQTAKSMVISDADWQRLAAARPDQVLTLTDYQLDQPKKVQRVLEWARADFNNGVAVEARIFQKDMINNFNVYLFAGVFLGIVFLFCACSVLHFKQLMDGREDASRFETLRKIGLSQTDERQVAVWQVLPLYALPLGLALAHGLVALQTMGRVLVMDVALPVALDLAGFTLIFGIFAALTTRAYLGMVRSPSRY